MVYADTVLSIVLVSIIIGIFIQGQSKMYELQNELMKKQKSELEDANLEKDRFVANMSHEIRTPINTIIGLNEMTLRDAESDEIIENAIHIQNASKMLLTLINDILDLSKIKSGKMNIVPVQYEIGTMFSELVNIIWIKAQEKKLEFRLSISEDLPSMLYGDEIRLKQVFTNILTNAVKYTKQGGVTLDVSCERPNVNKILLKVSVAVTVEQDIVDNHAIGNINFMQKNAIFQRKKYKQSFEAPDASVLIVDDNEMSLMVACKLLRDTKIQVDTASSGKQCLEMTAKKFYNVIFMDHLMPEMDGVKTLEKIINQENGLCKNTPVIALTANVITGAEKMYREKGFQSYIAKPINASLFEALLLKFLPKELVESSFDASEKEKE